MNNQIADFIIDEAYEDCNVLPMVCILTGKASYGLYSDHYEYVGLHMMDTQECLEHPDFRKNLQVIRKTFYEDMTEVPPGVKGGSISLDSYELWKFLSSYLKGSFFTYELLYMPTIHCDYHTSGFIDLMRQGCSNQIGRFAKNLVLNGYGRYSNNYEITLMAFYRLIQAIIFLREEEFVWNIDEVFDYGKVSVLTNTPEKILFSYRNPKCKNRILTSMEIAQNAKEIETLVSEVDRAMVATALPNECPKDVLQAILHRIKMTRLQWV